MLAAAGPEREVVELTGASALLVAWEGAEGQAQAKPDLALLAIGFDMRGTAAGPCKAVITCTPNMKQGNQQTK